MHTEPLILCAALPLEVSEKICRVKWPFKEKLFLFYWSLLRQTNRNSLKQRRGDITSTFQHFKMFVGQIMEHWVILQRRISRYSLQRRKGRAEVKCNREEEAEPRGEAEVTGIKFPLPLSLAVLPLPSSRLEQAALQQKLAPSGFWSLGVLLYRLPHHHLTTCTSGACTMLLCIWYSIYFLLSAASLRLSSLACQIACRWKRWRSLSFFFF